MSMRTLTVSSRAALADIRGRIKARLHPHSDYLKLARRLQTDFVDDNRSQANTGVLGLSASQLDVSVIIPTYNRKKMLRETLDSLAQQTFPFARFEVIVVDDGSTDGTEEIAKAEFPFQLHYLRQKNQGDAVARNTGVGESQAEILVSLDDDMILENDYLEALVAAIEEGDKIVASGTWHLWLSQANPLLDPARFQRLSSNGATDQELRFSKISTCSMAVGRKDFVSLGGLQDLGFPGSSMWSDVDFAYRAYLDGYRFLQVRKVVAWHRDYVYQNFDSFKKRMYVMAYRSVKLFQKYPDLIDLAPLFADRRAIDWAHDPRRLIVRKVGRQFSSTRFVLWTLERLYHLDKKRKPDSSSSASLMRWIGGGYITRGYRQGCRDLRKGAMV